MVASRDWAKKKIKALEHKVKQLEYANTMLKVKIVGLTKGLDYVKQVASWPAGVIKHPKSQIGSLQSLVSSLLSTIWYLKNRPSGRGGGTGGGWWRRAKMRTERGVSRCRLRDRSRRRVRMSNPLENLGWCGS